MDRYVPMLSVYGWVMSPDFSLYTDFPVSLQIYNYFRKHWIAAYLQNQGIHVVPIIGWSHPGSYEWCFDEEPKESCVAAARKYHHSREAFEQENRKEQLQVIHNWYQNHAKRYGYSYAFVPRD